MLDCVFRLGGDVGSTFSWTFCAELCVGLIIRSKKFPPGAALGARLVLVFGLGLSRGFECAGSDALTLLVGFENELTRVLGAVDVWLSRLGDRACTPPSSSSSSCLAAAEAVVAVAAAGSLAGFVGDLGRGLVKPLGAEALFPHGFVIDGADFAAADFTASAGALVASFSLDAAIESAPFTWPLGNSDILLDGIFAASGD